MPLSKLALWSFRRTAGHRYTLRPQIQAGISVVGLEPSCVSVFRDKLINLFPDDEDAKRLAKQSFLLSEFLERKVEHYAPPELRRKAVVHGHCHHKAIMKMTAEQALLSKLGLDFQVLDSGCCGMAGAFGFEKDHYTVSIKAGERVLLPAVRKADKEMLIIADGFSARTGRLWIEEGKATMAVKMPIDLAQNGSTRQALQQVKVQGDRWHLSVPPIIPPYLALRAQSRRKATGRLYHKRGPGTFLGRLIAATRFWRELSRGGRPKRWPLTVILLPNQIGLER